MDSLDFEFVSISDAKKASDESQSKIAVSGKPEAEQEEKKDWAKARKQQVPFDLELQPETQKWIDDLPEEIRPVNLAEQFARVANNIARVWRRPAVCDDVLDELLVDHRGTRQGFPPEVAMEISALAEYYRKVVYPRKENLWQISV